MKIKLVTKSVAEKKLIDYLKSKNITENVREISAEELVDLIENIEDYSAIGFARNNGDVIEVGGFFDWV